MLKLVIFQNCLNSDTRLNGTGFVLYNYRLFPFSVSLDIILYYRFKQIVICIKLFQAKPFDSPNFISLIFIIISHPFLNLY